MKNTEVKTVSQNSTKKPNKTRKRPVGRKKEFCLPFQQNMRIFRIKAGLSQADVANELGLGQPIISSYEAGHSEPPLATLVQLAEILGLNDVGDFFVPPSQADIRKYLADKTNDAS